tara:strand:+ start:243 stop:848 length:606 start_codon:yes stop_codon:yes gene_type:complete
MALVKYNNNSISAVTSAPNFPAGAMTLISTTTASSDSTISITSGIDNTYPIYVFKFINMHPNGNAKQFKFQADTGTNTSYNQTLTTTSFTAYHNEAGDSASLAYNDVDHAQGSGFQHLSISTGNDNDQSVSGELYLFEPSSTTFLKHFFARSLTYTANDHAYDLYVGGYFNTTTAITRVQFKYDSDTIDSGTIKLYGLKDS